MDDQSSGVTIIERSQHFNQIRICNCQVVYHIEIIDWFDESNLKNIKIINIYIVGWKLTLAKDCGSQLSECRSQLFNQMGGRINWIKLILAKNLENGNNWVEIVEATTVVFALEMHLLDPIFYFNTFVKQTAWKMLQ
jgi:hypothetical protein